MGFLDKIRVHFWTKFESRVFFRNFWPKFEYREFLGIFGLNSHAGGFFRNFWPKFVHILSKILSGTPNLAKPSPFSANINAQFQISPIPGLFGSGNGQAGGTAEVTQTVPSLVLAGTVFGGHSHIPAKLQCAAGQTASHCKSSIHPLSPGFTFGQQYPLMATKSDRHVHTPEPQNIPLWQSVLKLHISPVRLPPVDVELAGNCSVL